MSNNFTRLVSQSKHDNDALLKIIHLFTPKIESVLRHTKDQNREDLSQELKLKLISTIKNYEVDNIPGFFDIIEEKNKAQG